MSVLNAQHLSVNGRSLSSAEATALQCSLPLLSQRYRGTPVVLWGKITGLRADYWIAQALPKGDFGPAASFYSTDGGSTWTLLADLTDEQAALCEALRGPYQGQPNYEYKARQDLPAEADEAGIAIPPQDDVLKAAMADIAAARDGESDGARSGGDDEDERDDDDGEENEDGEDEEGAAALPPPKKRGPKFRIVSVTEAMRVAHFVQLHDVDCRLTVRGMYVLQGGEADGVRNGTFGGQPLHHAKKASCYLKMAVLGKADRNSVLYGPTYNPHTDFLRPITDDAPAGVWSLKYDATANVVCVRNLFYEGSLFWYRPGTLESGQLYYGTGERNFDVCFML